MASDTTSRPSPFNLASRIVAILAVIVLGISAGALEAEGAVLVPFWQSLPPSDFLGWYGAHAELLFNFFAPMEITATILVVTAALMFAIRRAPGSGWFILAAVLAIAVLLAFPLYFKDVNASFLSGTIPVEEVEAELERWAMWHWSRTLLAAAAFVSALLGTIKQTRSR